MELTKRKQAVLEAIIRAYIATGEPVGSKILTGLIENAPSSATLRNEMSELCELGFLEQPHISAGRIPTNDAYKLFVNSLMKHKEISKEVKGYIDTVFDRISHDPETLGQTAAEILSYLTGLTAFSYNTKGAALTLKRMEILRVSKRSVIVFLVVSDGRSLSRVCRLKDELSVELEGLLKDIFNKKIRFKALGELNKAYLQNIIASAGFDAFSIMPLITAVFDMAEKIAESKLKFSGEPLTYNIFGEEKAARILNLLNGSDALITSCNKAQEPTAVVFGSDTGFSDLKNTAIVVCELQSAGNQLGKIGIIGSDRMSYEEVIPSVQYIAEKLSKIMTEFKMDMED